MYINRIQDLLSKEARLLAVETLVLSHINNGITIWSTANITQLKQVKNLQSWGGLNNVGGGLYPSQQECYNLGLHFDIHFDIRCSRDWNE